MTAQTQFEWNSPDKDAEFKALEVWIRAAIKRPRGFDRGITEVINTYRRGWEGKIRYVFGGPQSHYLLKDEYLIVVAAIKAIAASASEFAYGNDAPRGGKHGNYLIKPTAVKP